MNIHKSKKDRDLIDIYPEPVKLLIEVLAFIICFTSLFHDLLFDNSRNYQIVHTALFESREQYLQDALTGSAFLICVFILLMYKYTGKISRLKIQNQNLTAKVHLDMVAMNQEFSISRASLEEAQSERDAAMTLLRDMIEDLGKTLNMGLPYESRITRFGFSSDLERYKKYHQEIVEAAEKELVNILILASEKKAVEAQLAQSKERCDHLNNVIRDLIQDLAEVAAIAHETRIPVDAEMQARANSRLKNLKKSATSAIIQILLDDKIELYPHEVNHMRNELLRPHFHSAVTKGHRRELFATDWGRAICFEITGEDTGSEENTDVN